MIQKTKFCSWKTGDIAKGCQQCVLGQKMVLFVTGVCPRDCFYCPLSEEKKDKDVIFANEWKLTDENDTAAILEEARLTEAKGVGITGGDPLVRTNRICRYIRLLKKTFGKQFHVHLYTILRSLTSIRLKKLYSAGLDEIRLHPDFDSAQHWDKISLVQKFDWDIGMEIPAIPGRKKDMIKMIDYFKDKIDFLNLNELEISDTNSEAFIQRGFVPKDQVSYGVKGSDELAKELMKKYGRSLRIHYCTTTLKDRVQLANRIRIRAKNVSRNFDKVTSEGMLTRGAIYLPELMPGLGYRKKLALLEKDKKKKVSLLKKLSQLKNLLVKKYKIPADIITIDSHKPRILTSQKFVKIINKEKTTRNKKELIFKTAIVTEYPTWDMTEIEVEFLD